MRAFRNGLLIGLLFAAQPAHAETIDGNRITIIDGDTVALPCAVPARGCSEKIRLYAIDAPESYRSRCDAEQIQGLEAKARLADLLRNQPVTIKRGEPSTGRMRDPYRRTLGALVTPQGDVAEIMLREGVVLPWRAGSAAKAARLQIWCGEGE